MRIQCSCSDGLQQQGHERDSELFAGNPRTERRGCDDHGPPRQIAFCDDPVVWPHYLQQRSEENAKSLAGFPQIGIGGHREILGCWSSGGEFETGGPHVRLEVVVRDAQNSKAAFPRPQTDAQTTGCTSPKLPVAHIMSRGETTCTSSSSLLAE